jgi:Tfp pilus assembly protein PilN
VSAAVSDPLLETVEAAPVALPLGSVVLPRVDLLPPEIFQARRFRRVQTGLGGAVALAVGLVALLYVSASGSVSDAQQQLDAATAAQQQLQTQTASYRDVTATYAQAASAEAVLTIAMGAEVRWSRLLDDLSLTVPDNVWVKELTLTEAAPGAAAGTPVTTAPPATTGAAAASDQIGTATFTGVGFSHDDVAVWLESLAGQKAFRDPSFSSATESLLGPRKIVTFTSTATLTSAALSGRYTKAGS